MDKDIANCQSDLLVGQQEQNSSSTSFHRIGIRKIEFTWDEIRCHSKKSDRWLVIDNRVYDVTKWLKHPGGQMVLNHYAGQDASVRIHMIEKKRNAIMKLFLLFRKLFVLFILILTLLKNT